MVIVPLTQDPHEDILGQHIHLFAKPENYTPPTKNPDDCICGGGKPGATGRTLIANCPCCDGVQILVEMICPKGDDCPNKAYIPLRVVLPPDGKMRLRYIKNVEPIS